jgi:syndecan 1
VTDPFVSPVAEPDVSITSLAPPAPGEFIGLPNFAFYGYEVRGPEPAPIPVDFGVPPAPPAQPDPPTLGPNEVNPEVDPGPITSNQPNADEATSDAAGGTASGVAAPGEASTGEASAGEGSTGQGFAGEGSTGESSGGASTGSGTPSATRVVNTASSSSTLCPDSSGCRNGRPAASS